MPNGISFPVPQSALLSTRVDGHQSMKIFKTGFVVGSDLLLMSEYFCTGSACRTCSCVKRVCTGLCKFAVQWWGQTWQLQAGAEVRNAEWGTTVKAWRRHGGSQSTCDAKIGTCTNRLCSLIRREKFCINFLWTFHAEKKNWLHFTLVNIKLNTEKHMLQFPAEQKLQVLLSSA